LLQLFKTVDAELIQKAHALVHAAVPVDAETLTTFHPKDVALLDVNVPVVVIFVVNVETSTETAPEILETVGPTKTSVSAFPTLVVPLETAIAQDCPAKPTTNRTPKINFLILPSIDVSLTR
jgi:hypothetical protein